MPPGAANNSRIDKQHSRLPKELPLTLSMFQMNTCVRLVGFYVHWGVSFICLHTPPRLRCNAVGDKEGGKRDEKKKNPRLVLVQAFSSAFCPLPLTHLLVTTSVSPWHFWKKETCLVSGYYCCFHLFIYLFLTFVVQHRSQSVAQHYEEMKLNISFVWLQRGIKQTNSWV